MVNNTYKKIYLEDGRLKNCICHDNQKFYLVHQNSWVACYSNCQKNQIIVSKLLIGLFDVKQLTRLRPDDLESNEIASAALAIKTAGSKINIPQNWSDFATSFKFE